MELILTQTLLLVVTIALFRMYVTVDSYKDDLTFINHKLREIDKEIQQANYYPQPEDFNTFDKEFNAPDANFEDMANELKEPNPYFHEPHEQVK